MNPEEKKRNLDGSLVGSDHKERKTTKYFHLASVRAPVDNMSAVQNESRKRSKKRYVSGKRWKGSRELEVGMQGILITCNMNERKCTAEAFNLLNEYADELYGPEKVSGGKINTN